MFGEIFVAKVLWGTFSVPEAQELNRGLPSDGLQRYDVVHSQVIRESEAQMPLKQGSNASVVKLPFR